MIKYDYINQTSTIVTLSIAHPYDKSKEIFLFGIFKHWVAFKSIFIRNLSTATELISSISLLRQISTWVGPGPIFQVHFYVSRQKSENERCIVTSNKKKKENNRTIERRKQADRDGDCSLHSCCFFSFWFLFMTVCYPILIYSRDENTPLNT